MAEQMVTVQFFNYSTHPVHAPNIGMLTPGEGGVELEQNLKTLPQKQMAMTLSDAAVLDLRKRGVINWKPIKDKAIKEAIELGKDAPILKDAPKAAPKEAPEEAKPEDKPEAKSSKK